LAEVHGYHVADLGVVDAPTADGSVQDRGNRKQRDRDDDEDDGDRESENLNPAHEFGGATNAFNASDTIAYIKVGFWGHRLITGDPLLRPLACGTKGIKVAAALILTVMLLDTSLLVSASLPHEGVPPSHSQSSGVSSPLALLANPAGAWSFADGGYLAANVTTRGEIMAYILTNPGVYLREMSEDLGLSLGVVQYHTWVLTRNGEVEEYRSGRYRRFFGTGRYQEEERVVISLLRQGTTGKILEALAGDGPLTHMVLARALGISSQALSWQMKRLKETGIVQEVSVQGQPAGGYCLLPNAVPLVRSLTVQKPRTEESPVLVPAVTS